MHNNAGTSIVVIVAMVRIVRLIGVAAPDVDTDVAFVLTCEPPK